MGAIMPEKEESMYCNKCGKVLSENDVFCPKCGQRVAVVPNPPLNVNANTTDYKQQMSPSNNPVNYGNDPANQDPAKKKMKKRGLIAAIIAVVVVALIVNTIVLIHALSPLETTSNKPKNTIKTPVNQEIDIQALTTPADLRGEGMVGYWASGEILDADGNVFNDMQIFALLHLDDSGNCQLRLIEDEDSDEFSGTYTENSANIRDSISDTTLNFSIEMHNGDLYLGMGEDLENLTFVFEGPYDEETLVYQNLEYLKAASFTTSAMLENQSESNLSYTEWKHGITKASSYWVSLNKLSNALEFAVDTYSNSGFGMGDQQIDKGPIVYSSYLQYDPEEVQGVIDLATTTNRIRLLASHFQITAQEAYKVLLEANNNVTQEAYKDEQFYGTAETYARRINTGSKVTLLICGTIASGGTLTLVEGAVLVVQGADTMLEVTQEEAYISYEIEGRESSKKALEALENIRDVTAPVSSIIGLKDLAGNGFDKFMTVDSIRRDLEEGKILGIKVFDRNTGKMQVVQVTPDDLDAWKAENNVAGYKLTNEDKQEIWREIWAMAQEESSSEEVVAQNPVQPTDVIATAEPIIEPTESIETEAPVIVSGNPFVGRWAMTSTYYPYGLDNAAADMGENPSQMIYEFKENLKMDIYVMDEGTKHYLYQDRSYQLDGDMAIINEINDGSYLVYQSRTICMITNGQLLIDFDTQNPVAYVLERID